MKICPASFRETCRWLKFPLNGLRAQSRVSPVVGLLPLASGLTCSGMAFPPFLMKHLYRCDSVVISSFMRTGYTTRMWGWLLGRIGYSITHHYPLYQESISSRDEIYEKNSRINLDRLQNKFTHCKGIGNNTGSRQTTGIQEELDTTCKQNASRQTTQDNKTLFPNWQKVSWKTSEETSRYVRPARVNKWPNSTTDKWWWRWKSVDKIQVWLKPTNPSGT